MLLTAVPSSHSEALPHADSAALKDTMPCRIFTAFLTQEWGATGTRKKVLAFVVMKNEPFNHFIFLDLCY